MAQATVFNPQTGERKVVTVGDANAFAGGFVLETPTNNLQTIKKQQSAVQPTTGNRTLNIPPPTNQTTSYGSQATTPISQRQINIVSPEQLAAMDRANQGGVNQANITPSGVAFNNEELVKMNPQDAMKMLLNKAKSPTVSPVTTPSSTPSPTSNLNPLINERNRLMTDPLFGGDPNQGNTFSNLQDQKQSGIFQKYHATNDMTPEALQMLSPQQQASLRSGKASGIEGQLKAVESGLNYLSEERGNEQRRAQAEQKRLDDLNKPIEVGGNLVRKNPTTGEYEVVYQSPTKIEGLSPANIQASINQIVGAFDNEPIVRNYNVIGEGYQFAQSLADKTNPTSTDDQGLIYAFAKAMDPNSAVKEGEYISIQKYAQSMAQTGWANLERMVANQPFLTPEARANMVNTINSKFSSATQSYENLYNEYNRRIQEAKSGQIGGSLTDYSSGFTTPSGKEPDYNALDNALKDVGAFSKVGNDTKKVASLIPQVVANSPIDKTGRDIECVIYSRQFAPGLPTMPYKDGNPEYNAEMKRRVINSKTPTIGSVAIAPNVGSYGHTMNVIAKYPDGRITIQEANYIDGKITRRTGTPQQLGIEGYWKNNIA